MIGLSGENTVSTIFIEDKLADKPELVEYIRPLKKLKAVGRFGSGMDNIKEDALRAKETELNAPIMKVNSPDGNTEAVAQLVFFEAGGLLRRVPQIANSMARGTWSK